METMIGDKIKEALFRKKMRQIDLARKIGKSPQQISDWIKGRKKPQVEDFIKLAQELDLISEIFPGYTKTGIIEKHELPEPDNLIKIEQKLESRLAKIEKSIEYLLSEKDREKKIASL
jgi:transcriptional regulator with XRE-family HTH domain